MSSIIEVREVSLQFGGVQALSDVSFTIDTSSIAAIIGPNGAGKSSMLNCINGLYRPQHGDILGCGLQIVYATARQIANAGIARTFQHLALFRGLSVTENLLAGHHRWMRCGLLAHALALPWARREEQRARGQVDRLIEFLGLGSHRSSPVAELAYGLQKRVDLGRALAMRPKVLLLDEPMAGMNVAEKQEMCRFIVQVNREFETTIVLIEHDIGVVMDISDHIVVLDHGRKIADASPQTVQKDPAVIHAYLGAVQQEPTT